jgi:hypothetical protein
MRTGHAPMNSMSFLRTKSHFLRTKSFQEAADHQVTLSWTKIPERRPASRVEASRVEAYAAATVMHSDHDLTPTVQLPRLRVVGQAVPPL